VIKNRFVLIDAFALIFRAYYALPPTLTKDGHLVNAVYGFASALLGAIRTLEPEYLAVGMDFPKPTLRHKEYLEYKAHRAPAPEDLKTQIPYTKELLKVMNIPTYAKEGYEGEDIIATIVAKVKTVSHPERSEGSPANAGLANKLPDSGLLKAPTAQNDNKIEYIIVTGDLDLLQLIDNQTKVYSMARGINQASLYDEKKVIERYGLKPAQFVDFKALKGDTSDNIPGVKGIGEKGASNLIREFGSLDNLYEEIHCIVIASETKQSIKIKDCHALSGLAMTNEKTTKKISEKLKISEKVLRLLIEQKEQAYLSQKLSQIQNNAPLEFRLEDAKVHEYNQENVIKFFNSLGFKSLIDRLPKEKKKLEQSKLL